MYAERAAQPSSANTLCSFLSEAQEQLFLQGLTADVLLQQMGLWQQRVTVLLAELLQEGMPGCSEPVRKQCGCLSLL